METPIPRSCGTCASGSSGCGCGDTRAYDWLQGLEAPAYAHVPGVVELRFKGKRTGFYHNADQLDLVSGEAVIVEAERGVDLGFVHLTGELAAMRQRKEAESAAKELPKIVRIATTRDLEKHRSNLEREKEAFEVGRHMVHQFGLQMKIADVEWQLDRNRITLYFTAERRVDFRKLVRELAAKFRTRVDLRQIGARDEAGRLGGLGSCGRELCCATWLHEFAPVAMHAAKVQDLPLNPVRLGGQCGRLKCCLNYELEQYVAALRDLPRVGKAVTTDRGRGQVEKVDIFRERVLVRHSDGSVEEIQADQVKKR